MEISLIYTDCPVPSPCKDRAPVGTLYPPQHGDSEDTQDCHTGMICSFFIFHAIIGNYGKESKDEVRTPLKMPNRNRTKDAPGQGSCFDRRQRAIE